jgi:hypothetical protein
MRAGDWEAAWRQTDRLELPRRQQQQRGAFVAQPHHLRWDGQPFTDRCVLVRCLHGLGDTLQYLRFVPQIHAQARALHFLVQPMLLNLLSGAPGLGEVSNAWTDDPPPHEVEIEVMELAYALRCTAATVPPPYPHLAARLRARRRANWLSLTDVDCLRVGLLWSASDWDTSRSIPLQVLAPVLSVPGVHFFALQQGQARHDPAAAALGIVPLWAQTEAIEDAAAAMLELDLVIAVDGMPAHLSATLGRPTWLLLKHTPDWRWMDRGDTSPWYPGMRLFRQRHAGDWSDVASCVALALQRLAGERSRPCASTTERYNAIP